MADLVASLKEKAKKLGKTVILPETEDERVLRAAEKIIAEGIAKVALVGNEQKLKEEAAKLGVSIEGAIIYDPQNCATIDDMAELLRKRREKKGMTFETAKATLLSDPRFFGAMLISQGRVDGMVAGSNSPTAHVLRAAILVIGPKAGLKTVSSSFVMITKTPEYGDNGVFIYADGGVIPNPTALQLADIAVSSAEKARFTAGIKEPKVAFLSFSTKGSADGESVTKVREAIEILKERNVDFEFDGELQLDAAIVPEVAKSKAPGSKVAGHANVLIFPDLNSGNIGYKLTQRLAGAKALGPLIQGLASPVHDLSRGCSVDDIVEVVAITAVESDQK
ncbi:phosphate acetyltransferase [Pseudoleptotrichia goodfellowii]|uniref:Phosphate acetyltransferase n=1 Tax=Pseudoleptotrichia goodfellowii F0264 TaxID=596323 RepID=D0GK82_9FUSO|nr:phosphate acetyltransferase [Pseudoleptotrichia goodfellowii]EEY35497.1 phosphate acetyltransferase [Pseudoleptotrichia goodfellowii F0264]